MARLNIKTSSILTNKITEVKSEITLKFNELPEAVSAPNKKVELLLTDQNGVVFTALINAKSWRKAEADVAAFSDWGGWWVCEWQAWATYRQRL